MFGHLCLRIDGVDIGTYIVDSNKSQLDPPPAEQHQAAGAEQGQRGHGLPRTADEDDANEATEEPVAAGGQR